jgi:hypothetical protein
MIAVRLGHLFSLLLALPLLHAMPFFPKRSRLFGVDVSPEVRYGSEGNRLMRSYQLRLLPFTLGTFLLACWTPPLRFWIDFIPPFAALWLLYRCHAQAVPFALPPPSIREASLSSETGLFRRMLWFAPPLVLLTATALYLAANWNRIPERFAVHFDLQGNPNGWSHRTVRGVFGLLILAALIILYLMVLYLVMELGSRRATRRSVMLAALAGPTYLIGGLFSLAGLLPFLVPPVWFFLLLVGAFLALFVWLMSRVLSQPSEGPPEVTPDRCWHGSFYYNPDDPALFVEARTGFGYTANFARRSTWAVVVAILLFTLGLFLLAPKLLA